MMRELPLYERANTGFGLPVRPGDRGLIRLFLDRKVPVEKIGRYNRSALVEEDFQKRYEGIRIHLGVGFGALTC